MEKNLAAKLTKGKYTQGLQRPEILIYPNPNNGQFTLSFSHAELVSASQTTVEIYNMLGEQVYNANLPQTPEGALNTINLTGQTNGIYLYRVISDPEIYLEKGK